MVRPRTYSRAHQRTGHRTNESMLRGLILFAKANIYSRRGGVIMHLLARLPIGSEPRIGYHRSAYLQSSAGSVPHVPEYRDLWQPAV